MSETNSSQQPQQSTEDNTVNLKVVNQVNPFLFFFYFKKSLTFFSLSQRMEMKLFLKLNVTLNYVN